MVALYVDDKAELPQNEWYVSAYDQKQKRTIGKKNAELMAIEEINAAGGVLVLEVEVFHTDSSDASNAEVATQSVTDLVSQDVSVIVGAVSEVMARI